MASGSVETSGTDFPLLSDICNCRYFSFRASVSRLGFAPRVLRLLHLSGIHLKYPMWVYHSITVAVGIALYNCTQLHNIRSAASCLNCYLLRMQHEAERYLRQKHGGVPNGPRRETEARKSRIVAKIQTPFHASDRAPFRTCDFSTFRASAQILFKRGFKKPI